ncbi:Nucleotide-binding universal stress protein, UspA family [Lentzea albidocapillata subsp. violacea]|uniref:Nucleotide-binding universal stress protein, UspA family n=1 Tax=Lentzea albidocapillata subsp. violacea TaxID=128104 RepID=A0A1G9X839_9PSEU|nr:universal stress protein [Lentzea albidocapillata]SDM92930.1 Nucleotide-binding universal stress protein, UspA family [Lentzea albidocapillata subsp. violacea]
MSTPVSATGRGAVVAGFDGSSQARQAVLWAAREAANRQRELVVVNAIRGAYPELTVNPGAVALPGAVTEEAPLERAEHELAVVVAECARVAPDIDVRPHVVYGHPTEVLSRVAEEAVLLVVGPVGTTGLTRALLGSVAADLVHTTTTPVVVARDETIDEGQVVVGVDGSDVSASAIGFGFDFAARHGCDLLAVHAVTDRPMDLATETAQWREIRDHADTVLAATLAGHGERYPDVKVTRTVSFDSPAQALLNQATNAVLLVVGSHGRGAVRRALLGSVSHALVYHAPCSVAVLRRGQEKGERL